MISRVQRLRLSEPFCCSSFWRFTSSRVNASRRTLTRGPLPDKNTACVSSPAGRRVATFRPTNVFPAPGTPVTKQMRLRLSDCASSTSSSIRREVRFKFLAPASNLAIASTECCAYKARAAFYNRGHWMIRRARPSLRVESNPLATTKRPFDHASEILRIDDDRSIKLIRISDKAQRRALGRFRCYKHRHNRCVVAAFVKVL